MTLRIVDVSKYQVERRDPLNLVTAQQAGFGAVNIALDRGRDVDVLPVWAPGYAAAARSLDMDVCTYRWLDGRMSGRDSARRAYARMRELGGPSGMAHAADTESNATEEIIRSYVLEMTGLIGRPIALYTGDWWWTAAGRGWDLSDIAPYLWAAPNAGYQSGYPGDDSPHWTAGYGGWPTLSVMQYAVKPLPGTGNCSLSALRDPSVWETLTGVDMTYPDPALVDARDYLIGRGINGKSIGIVGDRSHRSSGGYHVGNDVLAMIGKLHTDYSKRQTEKDRPGSNAAMALDIGGLSAQQLYELTAWIIAQCRAGTPDTRNIREVIGRRSPGGGVTRYDALGILADTGSKDHEGHTHISYYRDSEGEDKTALFRRYYEGAPIKPPALPTAGNSNQKEEDSMLICYLFARATGTKPNRWGLGVVSGGVKMWFEGDTQAVGNAYLAAQDNLSATEVPDTEYEEQKAQFVGLPA